MGSKTSKFNVPQYLIKLILGALLTTPWWLDRVRIFLSIRFNSYEQWLMLETTAVFLISTLVLFGFWPQCRSNPHPDTARSPFKEGVGDKYRRLIRAITVRRRHVLVVLFSLLVASSYWLYSHEWRYSLSRVEANEIGILVADFREAAGGVELAQGTYALLLKEEIEDTRFECIAPLTLRVVSTPAFFTSRSEANCFGEKMGADIVIWGELHNSPQRSRVDIRIDSPYAYTFVVGPDTLMEYDIRARQSEYWNVADGIPDGMSVRNAVMFNILPATIEKLMRLSPDRSAVIDVLKCSLSVPLPAPAHVFVLKYLAEQFFLDHQYAPACSLAAAAFFRASDLDIDQGARSRVLSASSRALVKYFSARKMADSVSFWARQVIYNDSSWAVDRQFFAVAFIREGHFDEALALMSQVWRQRKDTLSGDLLLDTFGTMKRYPDSTFLAEYDELFPGRFLRRGARRLLVLEKEGP